MDLLEVVTRGADRYNDQDRILFFLGKRLHPLEKLEIIRNDFSYSKRNVINFFLTQTTTENSLFLF